MSAEAVEQPVTPLRLSCGHDLAAVATDSTGRMYCGACAELAEVAQAGAEQEVDSPLVEEDTEAAEELVGTVEEHPGTEVAADHEGEQRHDVDGGEGAAPGLGLVNSLPQPAFGTRSAVQGPRGCWALNNQGEPCGAVKRRDADYCTAHSGLGVASDPSRYSPLAHEARRRQLETRAQLRLVLGDRGRQSARSVLREVANLNAERLAGTTVKAALDPSNDPLKRANLALRLIEVADPDNSATLTLTSELDAEAVESMSFSQLVAFASAHGIEPQLPQP